MELVIARCEEDLAWIRNVAPGIRATVYNKGPALDSLPSISLPNRGREAHSYLHHIVTRYESLSPVTVFCQGHPFDHCSNFHSVLRELQAAGFQTLPRFQWLGFIVDWDDARGERLFKNWSKNASRETLEMETFCRRLLEKSSAGPFVFFPGAQFVVTREAVHARPRSFYENALELSGEFPHAAHCFERTWDRVFMADGIPEKYRNESLPVYLKPIRRNLCRPAFQRASV